MIRILYTIGLFLAFILCSKANEDSAMIRANKLYDEGRFAEAIVAYDSILNLGYESHELYFNLGNAWYKSRKLGKSILNYERALKLKPGDEDTEYNLEMARSMIVDKVNEIPPFFITEWFNGVVQLLPVTRWSQLSIAAFIVALFLFLLYFLSRRIGLKKLGFWFGILFMLSSLVLFFMARHGMKELTRENMAIILEPSLTTRSSPDESGTALFPLHEGTKVEIINRVGDWVEIKLADGNKGWIKESMLEII